METRKYKELTKAFLLSDRKKDVSVTDQIKTMRKMDKIGVVRIAKKNHTKRIGKGLTKVGIITLPVPFSGSVAFIFIGSVLLLVADAKKVKIKITHFKGKVARKIRLLKVKVRIV